MIIILDKTDINWNRIYGTVIDLNVITEMTSLHLNNIQDATIIAVLDYENDVVYLPKNRMSNVTMMSIDKFNTLLKTIWTKQVSQN